MTTKSGFVRLLNALRSVREWRKHPLTVLGIVLTLLALVLASFWLWAGAHVADLGLNVAAELAGVGLTILVVDAIVQRREMQTLKQQLIREMSSTDKGIALRAARELDANGWLENGTLEGAYLWGANLQGAVLQGANLRRAMLGWANLQRANLLGVDLREAFLRGSNMQEARLWRGNCNKVDLREVNMQGALLCGASLREADLRDANMQGADLLGTNLQKADLRRAKLDGANLQQAKLDGANLQQVDLHGQFSLPRDQLAEMYGLRLATMPDGSRYNGCLNLRGDSEEARRDGVDPNAPAAMAEWYGVSLEEWVGGQTRALEHLLMEQNGRIVDYDVVLKRVEPLLVAATRGVLPLYDDIGHLFKEVYAHLRRHGIWPGGTHLAIYYATEHPKRNVDQEAAVPVPERVPSTRRVTVRELPGVEMMATLLHQGSFDDLGKTYTALQIWIEANGYRIAGPIREVYLRGPGSGVDPSSYLTEVQFPVEKA